MKLKPVDPKSGWIADNTTWKSGLTAITPAKEVLRSPTITTEEGNQQ